MKIACSEQSCNRTPPLEILLANPADTDSDAPHLEEPYELSAFPNLGLLTLGTALKRSAEWNNLEIRVLYLDGSIHGNRILEEHLTRNAEQIFAVGFSCYTWNLGACIKLAQHIKRLNPKVINVIGNDGFSALYATIMRRRQGVFDFGFYGNDVVEGFCALVLDLMRGTLQDLGRYPGLVFRDPPTGMVRRNPENAEEFHRLPYTDFSLLDSCLSHSAIYVREQHGAFAYLKARGAKATTLEIARGCLKFGGPRGVNEVPLNACDFCAINPGSKAIVSQRAERAWEIIRHAFEQGYDYFFITADELPSTFWPLLREMASTRPEWYADSPPGQQPHFMCYARADAFREQLQPRIDLLMNKLGYDHFWVGLESFSTISLQAMNKGIGARSNASDDLLHYNILACQEIARRGGTLGAGAVITHLGITPAILEENFRTMRRFLEEYSQLFVEILVDCLFPLPGSMSFEYLRQPELAAARGKSLGLEVDLGYLRSVSKKYLEGDLFNTEELLNDFITGCCPAITLKLAREYVKRTKALVDEYGISVW